MMNKMTEGDYIRSLNDEQLAEYIFKIEKNAESCRRECDEDESTNDK